MFSVIKVLYAAGICRANVLRYFAFPIFAERDERDIGFVLELAGCNRDAVDESDP